jgi:hypothetical protein
LIDECADACSECYRGPELFSEPETKALRTFLNEHQKQIKFVYNFHSNGRDDNDITAVFYQSKMGQDGSLNLNNIAGEIDWGAAIELIKFEGFYMFGGRTKTGEATNQLLIV